MIFFIFTNLLFLAGAVGISVIDVQGIYDINWIHWAIYIAIWFVADWFVSYYTNMHLSSTQWTFIIAAIFAIDFGVIAWVEGSL